MKNLKCDKYSFTARRNFPAGTKVEIVKLGKRAANDRAQVRTKEGELIVVRLNELEESN